MIQKINRKEQAKQTKHNIYSAASRLFAQEGYENITVQNIAEAASVSVGAFYHHFSSKEMVLNEAYRIFDEIVEEQWFADHPQGILEGLDFLISLQMTAMVAQGSKISAQSFKNQLTNQDKYILNSERFFYVQINQLVKNAVDTGLLQGDVHDIVTDILACARGLIYDWCLHDGDYDLPARGKRSLTMVLGHYRVKA